jgi:N6-adenosine-specific RNA methylase IME4
LNKQYNVILIDPAWPFRNMHIGGNGKSGAIDKYPVMTLEQIAAMPIPELADPKASVLFMWITKDHLLEGSHLPILKAWGFEAKTVIVWYKKSRRWGLGHWYQNKVEFLIVAVKGKVKALRCKAENVVQTALEDEAEIVIDTELIEENLLSHSEKPERFRQLIEMSTRGLPEQKFLEIFARKRVLQWDSLGFGNGGKDMRTGNIWEQIIPAPTE